MVCILVLRYNTIAFFFFLHDCIEKYVCIFRFCLFGKFRIYCFNLYEMTFSFIMKSLSRRDLMKKKKFKGHFQI